MIIEKVWNTGWKHKHTWKLWKGWFLFGFIPLYVKQLEYQD